MEINEKLQNEWEELHAMAQNRKGKSSMKDKKYSQMLSSKEKDLQKAWDELEI